MKDLLKCQISPIVEYRGNKQNKQTQRIKIRLKLNFLYYGLSLKPTIIT